MKYMPIFAIFAVIAGHSAAVLAQQAPAAGKTAPADSKVAQAPKFGPDETKLDDPFISELTKRLANGIDQRNFKQAPAGGSQQPGEGRSWTSIEIVLSFSVLVFGAMVFALQTWLILKMPLHWTPNAILRFNGLTLIITGAILLVTAGYSNEQMTPVIGLLGAIAGYLLGAADKPPDKT